MIDKFLRFNQLKNIQILSMVGLFFISNLSYSQLSEENKRRVSARASGSNTGSAVVAEKPRFVNCTLVPSFVNFEDLNAILANTPNVKPNPRVSQDPNTKEIFFKVAVYEDCYQEHLQAEIIREDKNVFFGFSFKSESSYEKYNECLKNVTISNNYHEVEVRLIRPAEDANLQFITEVDKTSASKNCFKPSTDAKANIDLVDLEGNKLSSNNLIEGWASADNLDEIAYGCTSAAHLKEVAQYLNGFNKTEKDLNDIFFRVHLDAIKEGFTELAKDTADKTPAWSLDKYPGSKGPIDKLVMFDNIDILSTQFNTDYAQLLNALKTVNSSNLHQVKALLDKFINKYKNEFKILDVFKQFNVDEDGEFKGKIHPDLYANHKGLLKEARNALAEMAAIIEGLENFKSENSFSDNAKLAEMEKTIKATLDTEEENTTILVNYNADKKAQAAKETRVALRLEALEEDKAAESAAHKERLKGLSVGSEQYFEEKLAAASYMYEYCKTKLEVEYDDELPTDILDKKCSKFTKILDATERQLAAISEQNQQMKNMQIQQQMAMMQQSFNPMAMNPSQGQPSFANFNMQNSNPFGTQFMPQFQNPWDSYSNQNYQNPWSMMFNQNQAFLNNYAPSPNQFNWQNFYPNQQSFNPWGQPHYYPMSNQLNFSNPAYNHLYNQQQGQFNFNQPSFNPNQFRLPSNFGN